MSPPPRTHRRLWNRHGRRASLRSEESLALGVAPVVAAHDAFGFLQSDAACGTSHALRPIWLASFVAAFSPPVARSPDCWRGGAPSTSGVTEPPDSGREHAPIAAVARRKKLDRKLGLTENRRFTVCVVYGFALYLHLLVGSVRVSLKSEDRPPGQRQSPCPDRGDRSGAKLKSGVLIRGEQPTREGG